MDKLLVGLVVYFLASYNSVFSQVNLSVSVGVNYSNFDLSLFPQVSQNVTDQYHYTVAFGYPLFNLGIGIEYSLNSISLYSGLKMSDRVSVTILLVSLHTMIIWFILILSWSCRP